MTILLRLLCGRYAKSIDDYMQARRKEFDAWRHVTESCDFNEAARLLRFNIRGASVFGGPA